MTTRGLQNTDVRMKRRRQALGEEIFVLTAGVEVLNSGYQSARLI